METLIHENLSTYGPIAVFVLLMLSGFGIALGEEMVTIPAGVFIASQEMGFWSTALAAYVGIVAADFLWFGLCYHYGTPLLHKRWIKRFIHPRRLLEVKHEFERRGTWLIVMARFIPSSRTTAITVGGILHMPFWKFALATGSCVLVTVPMQLGLGFLIGTGLGSPDFAETIRMVLGLVMLIVAVTVCFAWWTRRYAGRRRAPRAKASWLRRFRPKRARRTDGPSALPPATLRAGLPPATSPGVGDGVGDGSVAGDGAVSGAGDGAVGGAGDEPRAEVALSDQP